MNRIGCYGSILYHKPESNRCAACNLLTDCIGEVAVNKVKLAQFLETLSKDKTLSRSAQKIAAKRAESISPIITSVSPTPAKSKSKTVVSGIDKLKKKPKEFVQSWTDQGVDFKNYRNGTNPFVVAECGNAFAIMVMQMFMDQGKVTWDDLYKAFTEKLGWSDGTARSHINIVFDAFEFLGIITITAHDKGRDGYLI